MRINHVAVICRDLEAARQFFVRYFEVQSGELYHNPRTGLSSYFLSFPDGGSRLEIMTYPRTETAFISENQTGFSHLAIGLGRRESVDLLTRRLDNDGFRVISGPRVTGDGYYESVVEGPEHLRLELTE